MDFSTFFVKRILMGFFVSVTCITAAMALLGMTYESDARLGYEAFLSPLLFGLLTALPSFVKYSKRELSVRQAVIRNVLHLVLLEAIVLPVLSLNGLLADIGMTVSLGVTILVINLVVHLLLWINDKKTADTLNEALKKLQASQQEEA